jgi:hypothetical protein
MQPSHGQEGTLMPTTLAFICYLVAFLSFLATALDIGHPRVNLLGVGLAAWVLVPLVDTL